MNTEKIIFSEKYVLLDNEGTLCAISLLETFFEYFFRKLKQYLNDYWHDEKLRTLIELLKKENLDDILKNVPGFVQIVEGPLEKESVFNSIVWHTKLSRKSPAMKTMRKVQHLVWLCGIQSNELKYEIFKDVHPALKLWKDHGKLLFTYSTAACETQKIIFKNSNYGDLFEFLSGCFDLEVGWKTESSSYITIAAELGCSTSDILFITDIVAEADAASKAGCRALICFRPGNVPISDEDRGKFECIKSFDEVIPESVV